MHGITNVGHTLSYGPIGFGFMNHIDIADLLLSHLIFGPHLTPLLPSLNLECKALKHWANPCYMRERSFQFSKHMEPPHSLYYILVWMPKNNNYGAAHDPCAPMTLFCPIKSIFVVGS